MHLLELRRDQVWRYIWKMMKRRKARRVPGMLEM